jgi:hypothetical protein
LQSIGFTLAAATRTSTSPGPGHRIGVLLELQYFRTAIFVDNDRFHTSSPCAAHKPTSRSDWSAIGLSRDLALA